MNKKHVVVWGTGNVGRPAIRAVLSHGGLELAGVIVANPDKVGKDAGAIAGIADCGVAATDNWEALLDSGNVDCVVYTATADTRPEEALGDLMACLKRGINVVSGGFYALLHPASSPPELLEQLNAVCNETGASVFISGIDPGWVMDYLPVICSGATAGISEIRCREIFNYSLYDQPQVVREVIGFGGSMDDLPLMLHDFAIEMVWGPMLRILGETLGKPVERIEIEVERRALEETVTTDTMGAFEAGTQGAFRFEVNGFHDGQKLYVLEHVTRIHDDCAPDWPKPAEGSGCHEVIISGNPELHVSVHGVDPVEPGPAGGGNGSAAAWLVNAIPGLCEAGPGLKTVRDLPRITGAHQLQATG